MPGGGSSSLTSFPARHLSLWPGPWACCRTVLRSRVRTLHGSRPRPVSHRRRDNWHQTLSGVDSCWEEGGIQGPPNRLGQALGTEALPGGEALRGGVGEERTYHLIVNRGGWWVVVGVQSCRDWPPVSQVIILEEKGDGRGERVRLGYRLPHQLELKVRATCILAQSRVQTKWTAPASARPCNDWFLKV